MSCMTNHIIARPMGRLFNNPRLRRSLYCFDMSIINDTPKNLHFILDHMNPKLFTSSTQYHRLVSSYHMQQEQYFISKDVQETCDHLLHLSPSYDIIYHFTEHNTPAGIKNIRFINVCSLSPVILDILDIDI